MKHDTRNDPPDFENEADVADWLGATDIDDAERTRRADLVDQAEQKREGGTRTPVLEAIATARGVS
jgi:hypothetical protein